MSFQSTHPRRVRLLRCHHRQEYIPFQSTHPRRVRRFRNSGFAISTYFNPRTREGCDLWHDLEAERHEIFQSTHPRRVRRKNTIYAARNTLFQSTHPRRVRRCAEFIVYLPARISIHAPAKGATPESGDFFLTIDLFQSTHPRRVRRLICVLSLAPPIFQSTHPRRVRPFCRFLINIIGKISIHAPAKGATSAMLETMPFHVISIHAPAKGATLSHIRSE